MVIEVKIWLKMISMSHFDQKVGHTIVGIICYKQMLLKQHKNIKLAPIFYGPYKVLHMINIVAYKLELHYLPKFILYFMSLE